MWQWLNFHLLVDAVNALDDDMRDLVIAALEQIADDPFDPNNVAVNELPATSKRQGIRVAWLPGGLILMFRIHDNGPPPYAGPHLVVVGVRSIDDIGRLIDNDE